MRWWALKLCGVMVDVMYSPEKPKKYDACVENKKFKVVQVGIDEVKKILDDNQIETMKQVR